MQLNILRCQHGAMNITECKQCAEYAYKMFKDDDRKEFREYAHKMAKKHKII